MSSFSNFLSSRLSIPVSNGEKLRAFLIIADNLFQIYSHTLFTYSNISHDEVMH